ncbi:MAG: septum formation protein Maf [Flavobacteriaceae bacterium]|nr:septum formation protein Maf [Flavobacteriaceae bacterium]
MLHEHLKNYNIILASKSPRRQKFLADLGLDFTITTKEVEEVYPKNLQGSEITDYLAKLKSAPFKKLKNNDIVVTSDTIVWLDNKAIGKPKNREEAIKTLQKLSGKTHQVYTSVFIKSIEKEILFNDCTSVFFNELTLGEIIFYVEKFKPFDKAGGYGIQDWIGLIGIQKIEGSFYNVMGFPVYKFYREMTKF